MKKRDIYKSQQGSISLLLVLTVVGFAALMAYQIPSFFQMTNQLHARQKKNFFLSQAMLNLGQLMQQSYTMGQLDDTCSVHVNPDKFKPKKISGVTYCFPVSGNLCVDITADGGKLISVCASKNNAVLNWRNASGKSGSSSSAQIDLGEIKNNSGNYSDSGQEGVAVKKIMIPDTTDTSIWRSCQSPNICLRLAVCPTDETNCNLKDAQATQVVRLGTLDI